MERTEGTERDSFFFFPRREIDGIEREEDEVAVVGFMGGSRFLHRRRLILNSGSIHIHTYTHSFIQTYTQTHTYIITHKYIHTPASSFNVPLSCCFTRLVSLLRILLTWYPLSSSVDTRGHNVRIFFMSC